MSRVGILSEPTYQGKLAYKYLLYKNLKSFNGLWVNYGYFKLRI